MLVLSEGLARHFVQTFMIPTGSIVKFCCDTVKVQNVRFWFLNNPELTKMINTMSKDNSFDILS